MPKVLIKTPKPLQRVEIIRSERININDGAGSGYGLKNIRKGKGFSEGIGNELTVSNKTVFHEEFTFSGSNEPLEISLGSINNGLMPLAEVQKEVQDAYERGFEDGRELTRSTLEIELEKQQHWIRNFDSLVQDLRVQFSRELESINSSVVSLAVMIAEHVLEHEISVNPEIVVEQTRKAIQALDNDIVFKIHVHPYNVQILEEVKSTLASDSSKLDKAVVIANESIDQGGCVLETSAGMIDVRMKIQLEKIKLSLADSAASPDMSTGDASFDMNGLEY